MLKTKESTSVIHRTLIARFMMKTDQRRQYRLYLKVTVLLILPKGTSKLFKAVKIAK